MEQHICVFGDSTAWGAWDLEKGGWVNRLWLNLYDHEPYTELYNLSISGGNSATILERFESEARIRRATHLIFQTGGNDAAFEHDPSKPQVSPERFQANIREIIARAKAITPRILFVGPKGSDETRSMPVSWAPFNYTNEMAKRYGALMQETCESEGVGYVGLLGLLSAEDFEDGVHPTAAGHEKIFNAVTVFLKEKQWI